MKRNERMVQFFDLGLSAKSTARDIPHLMASPRSLDELMAELITLREHNLARKKIRSDSKFEYRLEDMEEHDDYWVLLINIVDTSAAHVVTNLIGGADTDREVIELTDERGIESSSHVIIFKQQNAAYKHLVLFEKSESLPFIKAVSFLNNLFKIASKHFEEQYTVPHPANINGNNMRLYCVASVLAHPSDSFIQELESGVINDITITTDVSILRGYDANVHAEFKEAHIKMNVTRFEVLRSGGNWKHLQKAISHANSLECPFVRVAFVDESGAGHTANLSTDTSQLVNSDKYVKKCKISGFGNALTTAFPIIHVGIRDKMLELIN
ncbi:hypothetical protein KW462_08075 [Vibrio fluvialis]|nr:hypothetical protein [Vibrio fluvialis]